MPMAIPASTCSLVCEPFFDPLKPSVLRHQQFGQPCHLTSAIGKAVKVEYVMANGIKTVSLIELPTSATHAPSSGAKPSRK